MIPAKALRHIIALLAEGDGDGAQAYLAHFPPAERAPGRVRQAIAQRCRPEFLPLFEAGAPWLANEDDGGTAGRVRLALREAEADGLAMGELSARLRRIRVERVREAVAQLVAAREVVVERRTTGGRPAEVFRLTEFAAGVVPANIMADPFAFRPDPLFRG